MLKGHLKEESRSVEQIASSKHVTDAGVHELLQRVDARLEPDDPFFGANAFTPTLASSGSSRSFDANGAGATGGLPGQRSNVRPGGGSSGGGSSNNRKPPPAPPKMVDLTVLKLQLSSKLVQLVRATSEACTRAFTAAGKFMDEAADDVVHLHKDLLEQGVSRQEDVHEAALGERKDFLGTLRNFYVFFQRRRIMMIIMGETHGEEKAIESLLDEAKNLVMADEYLSTIDGRSTFQPIKVYLDNLDPFSGLTTKEGIEEARNAFLEELTFIKSVAAVLGKALSASKQPCRFCCCLLLMPKARRAPGAVRCGKSGPASA